jgi:Putative amidoligase enzyme
MKVGDIIGQVKCEEREQNHPVWCLSKCLLGLEYEWEKVRINIGPSFEQAVSFDDEPTPNTFAPGPASLTKVTIDNKTIKTSPILGDLAVSLNKYFNKTQDGSLRNNGIEFVFKEGYSGSRLFNAINIMDAASRAFKFVSSVRTSMHVHLDTNTLTFPDDIYAIALLYAISEPFIYKFVGRSREGNNYCVPWYFNSQHAEVFIGNQESAASALSSVDSDHYAAGLRKTLINSKSYKYSGLNFFSLGDYGTLEFRHAPVNMPLDKIISWLNIIMRMKKFIMYNKIRGGKILDFAQKTGPQEFIEAVFADQAADLLRRSVRPHDDFNLGLKTALYLQSLLD